MPVMLEYGVWKHTLAVAGQGTVFYPRWPEIEFCKAASLTGASLAVILHSKPNLFIKQLQDDFILHNLFFLKILRQIKGVLNLPEMSIYAPICQNPCFKPGFTDAVVAH